MIFKDYYKILGLTSNRVTMSEIKIAYREQAKKYHPDVNIANKRSEERFKDINEAYRILSDVNSKRKYDRQWRRNIGRLNSTYTKVKRDRESISSDFMNMFFGNAKDIKSKNQKTEKKVKSISGENVDMEIVISIEDAFRGKEQIIGVKETDGLVKKFKVEIPARNSK